MLLSWGHWFWDKLAAELRGFGRFIAFCQGAAYWFFAGTRRWCRWSLLVPQFYHMGTRSAPVIMLLGMFIGMVLSIEMFQQFASFGQETRLGGVINISVVRHIGPVLAAVMLAGRVGGSVSAELGTMQVTEQLDAMRAMGADPVAHLVVPRIVACTLMTPVLTVFSDLLGVVGGFLVTVRGMGVTAVDYWDFSARFIVTFDVMSGLIKSVIFGLCIGMISCYKGFHCKPGAAGVGRAATDAFVTSFVAIIISNFFLAKFLKDLHILIWAEHAVTAIGG